ncbi:MAG TPA: ATP-binding protein [Lachnospiraceae bacterium]|nr:ATP-binding protein [Lachnospiraceae bacterium]
MNEDKYTLEVSSDIKNLGEAKDFIEEKLNTTECSAKTKMSICLCVEEIFMNVCSYAYTPGSGDVILEVSFSDSKDVAYITIIDRGVPYNPLNRDKLDIESHIKKRQVGGLGIFMTQNIMDNMSYEYTNHENRLTLEKKLTT